MLQASFQAYLKLQTMFPPAFIPDTIQYNHEIRIKVNATSKKLRFYYFMVKLYSRKNARKSCRSQSVKDKKLQLRAKNFSQVQI